MEKKETKKPLKTVEEIVDEKKKEEVQPEQPREIQIKQNERLIIMGFAPDSRNEAPVDQPGFDIWGINELYLEMPILAKKATAWFQLHGTEPPTGRDPNHKKALAELQMPVIMWRCHPEIPNSVAYPREQVLAEFDNFGQGMCPDIISEYDRQYFTNTISWLIALAIAHEYKEIHIYGVNMAQDQEYGSQRPSCEFFLGWARGKGIGIHLPKQSDLLLSGYQYGYDQVTRGFTKSIKRVDELQQRINEAENQRVFHQNQAQNALIAGAQLRGALENTKYGINLGPQSFKSVKEATPNSTEGKKDKDSTSTGGK